MAKKWIQKAVRTMRKDKPCTGAKFGSSTCPPGSKRYNLAKTFKKMAKKEDGGYIQRTPPFYDPQKNVFKTKVLRPLEHTTETVNIKEHGGIIDALYDTDDVLRDKVKILKNGGISKNTDFKNILKELECYNCGGKMKYQIGGETDPEFRPGDEGYYETGMNLQYPIENLPVMQQNSIQGLNPNYLKDQPINTTGKTPKKSNQFGDYFKGVGNDYKNTYSNPTSATNDIANKSMLDSQEYGKRAADAFSSGNWWAGIAHAVAKGVNDGKSIAAGIGSLMNYNQVKQIENYRKFNKRNGAFRPQYQRNYDPYGTGEVGENPAYFGFGGVSGANIGASAGMGKSGGGFDFSSIMGMMNQQGQQQQGQQSIDPSQIEAIVQAYLNKQNKTNINAIQPVYAENGGNIAEMYKAPINASNSVLEEGEILNDNNGGISEISGKKHSEGGEPMDLPSETKILSDKLKIKVGKSKKSFAQLGKKFSTDKDVEMLNNPKADKISKETAQMNIQNKNERYNKLFNLQEKLKIGNHFGSKVREGALQDLEMKYGGVKKYASAGVTDKDYIPPGSTDYNTVDKFGNFVYDPTDITDFRKKLYPGNNFKSPYKDQANFPIKFNASPFEQDPKYGMDILTGAGFVPKEGSWKKTNPEDVQDFLLERDKNNNYSIMRGLWNTFKNTEQGRGWLKSNKMDDATTFDELGDEGVKNFFKDDIYGVRTGLASLMLSKPKFNTNIEQGVPQEEGSTPFIKPSLDEITGSPKQTVSNPLQAPQLWGELAALTASKKPVLYIEDQGANTALGMYNRGKYLNIQPELNEATSAQRTTLNAVRGENPSISRANAFQAQANRYKNANQLFGQKYNFDAQVDQRDNQALTNLYLQQGQARNQALNQFEDKVNWRDYIYDKTKTEAFQSIGDKITQNRKETGELNMIQDMLPNFKLNPDTGFYFNEQTGETISAKNAALLAKIKPKADEESDGETTTVRKDKSGNIVSTTTSKTTKAKNKKD